MKKKRIFATIMASLMSISMMSAFPMGAWAGSNYNGLSTDTSGDNVSNNTTNLKKILVVEDDANIPACSFTFTASAGSAVNATDDTLAVLAGVGAENITYKLVTGENATTDFYDGKTTINSANKTSSVTLDYASQKKATGDITNDDYVTITDDESKDTYSAVKTIQLDFSNCGFTEPGVYRYIITETKPSGNQGVTDDTNTTRTIDVYVEDATTTEENGTTSKKLKIKGYVMYVGTQTTGPSNETGKTTSVSNFNGEDNETIEPNGYEVATAKKSVGFKNIYSTHDLTFGKEVTGNQGSKDKYFKFTVNITGAVAGTIYDVDISKADAKSGTNAATLTENQGQANPTSITVGADGTVSTDFYLQDGQSIIIKGIADGTSYTITEAQEDYTPSAAVTGDTTKNNTDAVALSISADKKSASVSDDGLTADTEVTFTNHRNGTIPTGIILSIAPTVIIGLALIGGIVFLIIRNKKRKYEE